MGPRISGPDFLGRRIPGPHLQDAWLGAIVGVDLVSFLANEVTTSRDDRKEQDPVDIRTRRKRLGMRLQDVASQLDIPNSRLAKWERGLSMPDHSSMARLAAIFDTHVQDLVVAQHKYARRAIPGEGYTTRKPTDARRFIRRNALLPVTS